MAELMVLETCSRDFSPGYGQELLASFLKHRSGIVILHVIAHCLSTDGWNQFMFILMFMSVGYYKATMVYMWWYSILDVRYT